MLHDQEHGARHDGHEAGGPLGGVAEPETEPEERERASPCGAAARACPEPDQARDDEEGHHHVGQRQPGVPEISPGGGERERRQQPGQRVEHLSTQKQRGPDAGDPAQRRRQNRGQLGHFPAAERERCDRPDEERRLLQVDFAADARHQPVAGLDHVPGEERVPGLVTAVEDALADPREEEHRGQRHGREHDESPMLIDRVVSARLSRHVRSSGPHILCESCWP